VRSDRSGGQEQLPFHVVLQESPDALHGQFDLKYWPSLSDFLQELASDAEGAVVEATDPLTAAATMASRPSRTDFIKALLAAIDENSGRNYGQLPKDTKSLTARSLPWRVECWTWVPKTWSMPRT
jgi:hypothetical protein